MCICPHHSWIRGCSGQPPSFLGYHKVYIRLQNRGSCWAVRSAGRSPALQAGGRGFKSHTVHFRYPPRSSKSTFWIVHHFRGSVHQSQLDHCPLVVVTPLSGGGKGSFGRGFIRAGSPRLAGPLHRHDVLLPAVVLLCGLRRCVTHENAYGGQFKVLIDNRQESLNGSGCSIRYTFRWDTCRIWPYYPW